MEPLEVCLERKRTLSPSTLDFRFSRTDGNPVDFKPGQFYRFVFEDKKGKFERSYSLCNFGEDIASPYLDLVISSVAGGRATNLLFNAEPGLIANVTGPFGRLLVPEVLPDRLFMVATSVGIAPFIPMLTQLETSPGFGQIQVYFVYGTRDGQEFVYGDLLRAFAAKHANFHLMVCFSRETPASDMNGCSVLKGYVQDQVRLCVPDPETDHFLLCGNPKMIDETYAELKSLGFAVRQVVREKYVFAKDKLGKQKTLNAAQKKLLEEKMKKYRG